MLEVGYVSPDWRFDNEQKDLVVEYASAVLGAHKSDFTWKEIILEKECWEDGSDYIELFLLVSDDKISDNFKQNKLALNMGLTHLDGFIWGISYK